ncbi:helix-turn-helix domain-containing protein [Microbacterium sp. Mu-80]|uniref:Helix-turn-helix domain-containing protein n=1 Tax=Microbacterium bandirmense TaxID=3122050 RepID=A0ABU8L8Z1_9MICO
MTHSDSTMIAERVRDGVCVLGCTLRGVHFATCAWYGVDDNVAPAVAALPNAPARCRGCAPSPAHTGSVICSRCFGRMRGMLRDAPDMVGRLRSLSDPTKAMQVAPVKVSSRPVEAVAPVGPDLLDAADAILANLRDWAHAVPSPWPLPWHARFSGMSAVSAYLLAKEYAGAIIDQLEQLTADPARVVDLAEAVIVVHPEDGGERPAWSIADAAYRWGVERRDRHVHPDVDAEPDREISAQPVREWYDPTLSVKDAAARVGVKPVTVRKWVASGDLPVAMRARGPRGSVMLMLYASQVDRVARDMAARGEATRFGAKTNTPELSPSRE